MPKYLFREGVDVSTDINDIIITTPYATRSNPHRRTFRIQNVKEPLKELLASLSSEGVESNKYLSMPETIESASTHLALGLQLKNLYEKGLLIHAID